MKASGHPEPRWEGHGQAGLRAAAELTPVWGEVGGMGLEQSGPGFCRHWHLGSDPICLHQLRELSEDTSPF